MVIEQSKLNGRNCGQVKRKTHMAQFKLEKSRALTASGSHGSGDAAVSTDACLRPCTSWKMSTLIFIEARLRATKALCLECIY